MNKTEDTNKKFENDHNVYVPESEGVLTTDSDKAFSFQTTVTRGESTDRQNLNGFTSTLNTGGSVETRTFSISEVQLSEQLGRMQVEYERANFLINVPSPFELVRVGQLEANERSKLENEAAVFWSMIDTTVKVCTKEVVPMLAPPVVRKKAVRNAPASPAVIVPTGNVVPSKSYLDAAAGKKAGGLELALESARVVPDQFSQNNCAECGAPCAWNGLRWECLNCSEGFVRLGGAFTSSPAPSYSAQHRYVESSWRPSDPANVRLFNTQRSFLLNAVQCHVMSPQADRIVEYLLPVPQLLLIAQDERLLKEAIARATIHLPTVSTNESVSSATDHFAEPRYGGKRPAGEILSIDEDLYRTLRSWSIPNPGRCMSHLMNTHAKEVLYQLRDDPSQLRVLVDAFLSRQGGGARTFCVLCHKEDMCFTCPNPDCSSCCPPSYCAASTVHKLPTLNG